MWLIRQSDFGHLLGSNIFESEFQICSVAPGDSSYGCVWGGSWMNPPGKVNSFGLSYAVSQAKGREWERERDRENNTPAFQIPSSVWP